MSYLEDLRTRLGMGLRRFGTAFAGTQVDFLLRLQRPDGGLAGRQGASDLYYTAFGLRLMGLLDVRSDEPWQRAGAFLADTYSGVNSVVDALSLVESQALLARALRESPLDGGRVADVARRTLVACRQPDGVYAAQPGLGPSVYHTFLAIRCDELLGEAVPWTRAGLAALLARQSPDGGFVDQGTPDAGGTNPTAAAMVLMARSGQGVDDAIDHAAGFISQQQRTHGGFAAHADAPRADLLSTFTAMAALDAADRLDRARLADVGRYVRGLALDTGGFRACCCDTGTDVEYTYYGLGTLGLLGARAAERRGVADHDRVGGDRHG